MRTSENPSGSLRGLHDQALVWSSSPDDEGVEQSTVQVPLDYTRPDGPRLSIALSRSRARAPQRRRGILLALNGGPGGYFGLGRGFAARLRDTPVGQCYDVIGFDPRGTGDSTPLNGEITPTRAPFDSRPADEDLVAIAEDVRLREKGNQRAGGGARPHHSTRNIARDMDLIRQVLGEPRINYLGYTYGTYLGAVYGSMFPDRLDRSVLDSCVHPHWTWREQFMAQGRANRANVDLWADWTAQRHSVFELGRTADEVIDSVETAADNVADQAGKAMRSLYDRAMGSYAADRSRWAELAHLVAELRTGDRGAAQKWLAQETVWPPTETEGTVRCGVLDAVTLEKDWPTDLDVYLADMRYYRKHYPYGLGVMRAQPWVGTFRTFDPPEEPVRLSGEGYPTGLIVQADGDPIDIYEGGAAMAGCLGHRLITVADSGHHEIYAFDTNPEVDAIVNAYLIEGTLPTDQVCHSTVPRPDIPADRS